MKVTKPFCFAAGLLLAAGLTGCQKEKAGVYQPTKKIQQIYCFETTPYQHWDWSNDRLSSITHYTDIDFKSDNWVEHFTYENNRVSRVDNYTNSEYVTYDYDGDQLKTATMFYHNEIICSWKASYDNGKINKLTGSIYEGFKKNAARLTLNPLARLLPTEACRQVTQKEQKMVAQRHTDETLTIVLLLTWNGEHIDKIIATGNGEYMEMQLQYDDKHCPFYGFMGGLEDHYTNYFTGHTGFTKNNITRMIYTEESYSDTLYYAYQYDRDGYPILQTVYYAEYPEDKLVLCFEY